MLDAGRMFGRRPWGDDGAPAPKWGAGAMRYNTIIRHCDRLTSALAARGGGAGIADA